MGKVTKRRSTRQLTGKRAPQQLQGKQVAKRLPAKKTAKKLSAKPPVKRLPPKRSVHPAADGRIEIESVGTPGYRTRVDATKYAAMKKALLKVLPKQPPGKTQAEMVEGVVRHLPQELFPGGAKAAWWVKTVQLDLEAKRELVRDPTKPLTWRRVNVKT